MPRKVLTAVMPLTLALVLVVTACSGGGDDDGDAAPTATRAPQATTQAQPTDAPQPAAYRPPHDRPGPAADRILFKSFHVDRAPLDFLEGAMDFYIFSLKTAAARELRKREGVRLDEAPATTISLVLNPAPDPDPDKLNPFSIKEIRQAVQYLVNRDFIANDIYQGMALSMLTHLSPTDFDFLTIFDLIQASDYRYDPELARSIIDREMERAGALKVGGKWEINGQPIRIKFIVRVEDERRDVGDLVRAELDKAGFNVAPSYQQFAPAVLSVYSSDPQSFEWHMYTEGWSRGAPTRYDFAGANQFLAPWQGNMPGWRESGFWQYESAELDDLGQRLFTGDFGDVDERNDIYRRMTDIGLDESIRVWIAAVQNTFPLSEDIQGITSDLVAGPKTARSIREAYIPGQAELTLGNLWVWTERSTWNPIGGFGDLYSNDIWRNLADPPVANHPFTGLPVPFRAEFDVETAGPGGKLAVPEGAIQWDSDADRWVPATASQATSKVTFDFSKYFESKWHHGQAITMADVIYSIAQGYELAFDSDKTFIETALGVTARPYLNTFRGYRILDNNQIEVYVDFWHFEEAQIGSYATPTSITMPWEILAAMDDLVFEQRRAAYSDTASARFDVPWISLAMKSDARLVRNTLREQAREGELPESYFTIGNRALVSPQEAEARYQAAIDWFELREHLVISNGPFFLTRYDPPAQFAEIQAFRDPTYPFKPGDFYLGAAPRIEITRVHSEGIVRGQDVQVEVEVEGPGQLGVRYVFFDPSKGEVIATGEATSSGTGALAVRLDAATTAGLDSSLYQLLLAAFSDEIAAVTQRRVDLEATG